MTNAPVILFRLDASPIIGWGHAIRCLSIAGALIDLGGQAIFGMAESLPPVEARILAGGCHIRRIDAVAGMEADAAAVLEIAGETGAHAVLVDHYGIDQRYLETLHTKIAVAVLDDLCTMPHLPVDLVINPAAHAPKMPYHQIAPGAVHLLGEPYALLRREFRDYQGHAKVELPDRRSILVMFGGTDPLGLTAAVAAGLAARFPAVTIDAVIGDNPVQSAQLQALGLATLRLHRNPPDLAVLMAAAGLAVSAAGGTVAELAAMGVPALIVTVADNQRSGAVEAPYPVIDGAAGSEAIADQAADLWRDPARRAEIARTASARVDGLGSVRVAEALLTLAAARKIV